MVEQSVVGVPPLAPHGDSVELSQHAQLLRGDGRPELSALGQLLN
jgi:hypothetical protein